MNDAARVLEITIAPDGHVGFKGDEFSIGELIQIGNQVISLAQSQTIRFSDGKDTKPKD